MGAVESEADWLCEVDLYEKVLSCHLKCSRIAQTAALGR